MKKINSFQTKPITQQSGATMVEYAFMVALIAIVSVAMITGIGTSVNNTFSVVNSAFASAPGGG